MRFIYLRGGASSLLIDTTPGGALLPQVVHFGVDLGDLPEFELVLAARPVCKWGARLDQPRAPCVLPGLEAGYFGVAAIEGRVPQLWKLASAVCDGPAVSLRLAAQGGETITIEYDLNKKGLLRVQTIFEGLGASCSYAAAAAIPLPSVFAEVMTFGGDWAREFNPQRQLLGPHAALIESVRGRGGHDRFPGFLIGERNFSENHGQVIGVSFGWSGSHRLVVDAQREGDCVVQAGERLSSDDEFPSRYVSPPVYFAYSNCGSNGVAQTLHDFLRTNLLPKSVSAKPRPVHYNTWEAVYFQHDLATLKDLADRAATVGAERFVLDDGWFKGRLNDSAGLGDWQVDSQKYPDGLTPLIQHVHAQGMEFGLWVEPEMVNPDSDLARAHPDWVRRDHGDLILQRHQAVLDITRADVAAYLFEALHSLLSAYPIAYLKWDMNRDLTGGGHSAYTRALWALIDKLRAAHPSVEIETCASGGGRCDFGMLERTERVWVSDSNDALDRFDIQRHANLFLPLEVSGVHVGPARCHITGRRLGLDLRAHVALFGHMGLEADLRELDERERDRLARHVANYQRFRKLLHSGNYWHLTSSHTDYSAIGVTTQNEFEGLYLIVRHGSRELGRGATVLLPGLTPSHPYVITAVGPMHKSVEDALGPPLREGFLRLRGHTLGARGLDVYLPRPETSLLLHVSRT